MRQVYSYVFFIAEYKSTVRLRGLAVIIREKRKNHNFLMFFDVFFELKKTDKDKTNLTLNETIGF